MLAEPTPSDASERLVRLLADYRPLPGVYDEMVDPDGEVRAHWRGLLAGLAGLGQEELARRFAAAGRYLRDSGVFYRVYEDKAGTRRGWPLTPIPLVIAADEWEFLQASLAERAQLIETVTADIYGAGKLFRENRFPPRSWPGARNSCGRWSASRRPAAPICASMRPISPAAPTAAGGCCATGRRPRPEPATRWRTGSRCRTAFRMSTAICMSTAWRRFFKPCRPNSSASTARPIRGSAC